MAGITISKQVLGGDRKNGTGTRIQVLFIAKN